MSVSVWLLVALLAALGFVLAPAMLIWGWVRWARRRRPNTVWSALSLGALIAATGSAALYATLAVYARFHYFGFLDPDLARFFRWGLLLSAGSILFGINGAFDKSPLRWQAPLSGLGTLAIWLLAAAGE
jgi:hypothetical protein